MAIARIHKKTNYTVIDNGILKDKNLSLKAKGLLITCLSLPDGWKYSVQGLVSICKEGREAIENTLKELSKQGYLFIEKHNDRENGQFNYIYNFYEDKSENPHVDNPEQANPEPGNQEVVNPLLLSTKVLSTKVLSKERLNTKDIKDIMSEVSEDTIEQPVKEEEKYNKESFERKIVDKLIDHVVKLNPRQKEKPKTTKQLNAWCDEVEKMIRIDKFSEEEVEMMLDFAITDSFWHKNILSTAKLRKQTDKLMIAIKAKNKGGMEKKLENNGRMDEPEITPEQREAVRQLMLREGELW